MMSNEYNNEIRQMVAYSHMNRFGELDEVHRKAQAFDRLYAEFDKGDKDLSKADFDAVYKLYESEVRG